MKLRVRCTYIVEVDFPDDPGDNAHSVIEENGCPGTGIVGAALYEAMDEHEKSGTCWACALGGTNQIIMAE